MLIQIKIRFRKNIFGEFKNNLEDVEDDESSEPVEFLETMNGDNLVKGDKVN